MPLDAILRGILEKNIDEAIQGIPYLIQIYRQSKTPEMNIKTMEDYILGLVHGYIMKGFLIDYRSKYFQNPSSDVNEEAGLIIYKRSREIQEAIFSQG
jgi:hypothetical protein